MGRGQVEIQLLGFLVDRLRFLVGCWGIVRVGVSVQKSVGVQELIVFDI